jgi:Ni/Fe-hydrogenase subunit HybB-like protein
MFDLQSRSILRQMFVDLRDVLEIFLKISTSQIGTESCRNEVVEICFSISETFYFLKRVAMVVLSVFFMHVVHMHVSHCFQE